MRVPQLKSNVRGYARVRFRGRDLYFGKFGTPESEAAYKKWLRGLFEDRAAGHVPSDQLTVADVLLRFNAWAKTYYVDEHGEPNKEFKQLVYAQKHLNALHGDTLVEQFGPLALKQVRAAMVADDNARTHVNHQVQRLRRIFKWAVAEELVPPSVLQGLQAVQGLKLGRSAARESVKKKPATEEQIEAVLPHVSPTVAAMVRIQRMTGMRPGNVTIMRPCDIATEHDAWEYRPPRHKNAWRGGELLVLLGPKCQEILRPFMATTAPDGYLFSPQASVAWHSAQRRAARKSKVQPSQLNRRKKRPHKPPGSLYTTGGYRQAVHYGIDRHNASQRKQGQPEMEPWTPAQLRKSRATELRRLYGIEAAQVSLGHAKADVTQLYAERDFKLALRIALESG